MFNRKKEQIHTLLLFCFCVIQKLLSINCWKAETTKRSFSKNEIKKEGYYFTSNPLYLFYSDLFRKMIISSTYQFLQIQAPYSSYNKLGKDLATTNLVDQVSKLWLFHRRV